MIEPQGPIQIQLPPAVVEIVQQWPAVLARLTAQEAKPAPSSSSHLYGLIALAAFALGLLAMLAGQFAWGHWGV